MSEILRIAFLHLAPVPSDLEHNRRLVETGLAAAGDLGAQWVLTPELCTCGYEFVERLGDEWIQPQPDAWTQKDGGFGPAGVGFLRRLDGGVDGLEAPP